VALQIRELPMHRRVVWACTLAAAAFAAGNAAAADATAGKKKAAGTCAVCHGIDGLSKNPEAPNLAGDNADYLVKQLNAFKNGERKNEMMSIIAQSLGDDDVANVAAWYASLKVTVTMP
jgi:cytochrome c553